MNFYRQASASLLVVGLLIGGLALAGMAQTPSRIRSTIPQDGQIGVQSDAPLHIGFSATIQDLPGLPSAFDVHDGAASIPFDLSIAANRKSVTLRLSETYSVATGATLVLTMDGSRIIDDRGLAIDADGDGAAGGTGQISFVVGIPPTHPLGTGSAVVLGRVFDVHGAPLAGALVDSVRFPAREGDPPLPVPSGISDSSGNFSYRTIVFTGTADFLVRVRKPDHSEVLRHVTVMAGTCYSLGDVALQPVTPRAPVSASAGTAAPLVDPVSPGAASLSIPPAALQQNSNVGVTVLTDASLLREELPPLVASAGTFVDVAGVFGEQTNVPVTMTFANTYQLPIGTRVPFGKVDHNTLEWSDLRALWKGPGPVPDSYLGEVKSDGMGGTFIEVQFDHFCSICTGYCLPFPVPTLVPGKQPSSGHPKGPNKDLGNSIIERREGFLWETVDLPGFQEFGREVGLTFGYASNAAAPTATLHARVNYNSARPVERTTFGFQVEGRTIEATYDRSQNNQEPHATWIWDGVNGLGELVPTGSYLYEPRAVSLNADSRIALPAQFGGVAVTIFNDGGRPVAYPAPQPLPAPPPTEPQRVTLVNLVDSPYGAGWSLTNQAQLTFDPDGCVIAVHGNADFKRYEPDPADPNGWASPPGDVSVLTRSPVDGSYTIAWPDGSSEAFSPAGKVLHKEDRYGYRTSYTYSGDLLRRITTATGHFWTFGYIGGKLRLVTDSADRVTRFEVNGSGDLIEVRDAGGAFRRFVYDSSHRLTQQIKPRGERSEYDYRNGRVVEARVYDIQNGPLLRRRQWQPSVLNGEMGAALAAGMGTLANPIPLVTSRVDISIDGRGETRRHFADESGRTTSVQDQLGHETRFQYDSQGRVSVVFEPNTLRRDFAYDAMGRLSDVRTFTPQGARFSTRTTEYGAPFDQPSRIIDEEGKETTLIYDTMGTLMEARDHLGNAVTYAYGDTRFPDLATRTTSPTGEYVDVVYDEHANIVRITDYPDPAGPPSGRPILIGRDAIGRATTVTNGAGHVRTYTYDALNRTTSTTNQVGETTQFSYLDRNCACPGDAVATIEFANQETMGYEFDGLGRMTRRIDQAGRISEFAYDEEGNLTAATNRLGQTIRMSYDAGGFLISKEVPGGATTQYQFDAQGALIEASEVGCVIRLERDFLSRITRTTSLLDVQLPSGQAIRLDQTLDATYDRVSNRTSLRSLDGLVDFTYAFDDLHRLGAMMDNARGGATWGFGYDDASRRSILLRPGGAPATTYGFGPAGQLESIQHATTPALSFNTSVKDGADNILFQSIDLGPINLTSAYAYDGANQITGAIDSLPLAPSSLGMSLSYDATNRPSSDGRYTYVYDAEGRLTRRDEAATGTFETFQWDAEGRLLAFEQHVDDGTTTRTVLTTTYTYDPLGRRIAKDVNGVVTRWLYDEEDILVEYDGRGRVEASFIHGPDIDEVLAVDEPGSAGIRYLYANHAGSTFAQSDASGLLSQIELRDEFGRIALQAVPGVWSVHGATGRLDDLESGLRFHRARFLDPNLGRFLSEDPAGPASSLDGYSYAASNPLRFSDPTGEWAWIAASSLICAGADAASAWSKGARGWELAAAAAGGAVSGAIGSLGGPLGGSIAKGFGRTATGLTAKGVSAGIGALGGVAGAATSRGLGYEPMVCVNGTAEPVYVVEKYFAGKAVGKAFPVAGLDSIKQTFTSSTRRIAPNKFGQLFRTLNGRRFLGGTVAGKIVGAMF